MKTKNNLLSTCITTSAAISSIALLNKLIFLLSDQGVLPRNRFSFHWRFGAVSYNISGKGKPLLLIHDLLPGNSDVEWKNIIKKLSAHYTVYTLDLPGFGRSDKPAITYTNYLYVQLITDFVKSVIGSRTDVIASGSSSGIAIMSCCNEKSLFDRIMLINPDSIEKTNQIPSRQTKLQKRMIECPVIGTLLYQIMVSRYLLKKDFSSCYFANPCYTNRELLLSFHEAAHLGGYHAKYIYSSIAGKYTNFGIAHKLAGIDNKLCIVGGAKESSIQATIQDYQSFNPAIESFTVEGSRHFPQIEKPEEFFQLCQIFFSLTA